MKTNKVIILVLLSFLLLSTSLIIQPTFATENSQGYNDITVQRAHRMIKNHPEMLLLDVRNQSEYNLGHLFNATLMPLFELQNMTILIQAYKNTDIIVYCYAGGRSAQACQILVDQGFTKVHNMQGGINAWLAADYPIFTTTHLVTFDANASPRIDIQPMLKYNNGTSCGCNSNLNYCGCNDNTVNQSSAIVFQNETFLSYSQQFDLNGTQITVSDERSLLWAYNSENDGVNETAELYYSTASEDNLQFSYYSLYFAALSSNYNLTILTNLLPNNDSTFNTSFTSINYVPVGQEEILSKDVVVYNSSVTLSKLFSTMGTAANDLARTYRKSGDSQLVQLAERYNIIGDESKELSKLVRRELSQYNWEIGASRGIISDYDSGSAEYWWCTAIVSVACSLGFSGAFDELLLFEICSLVCIPLCLGPEDWPCILACYIGIALLAETILIQLEQYTNVCEYSAEWLCTQIGGGGGGGGGGGNPVYVSSIADYGTWGAGGCNNPNNAVGSPDGNYAQLYGGNYNDGAFIVGWVGDISGEVYIYGYSYSGYYTHLHVYTSYNNNYDWTEIGVFTVSSDSPQWIDCGYGSNFRYIAIAGIDDNGMSARMEIDSVRVGS
jgi:rhodanese-related sulfurtransferase